MTNVIGKTYSNRANALRACKKQFGATWADTVEVKKEGGAFVVAALETDTVVKINKRLNMPKAVPTTAGKGAERSKGAVQELWEAFPKLLAQGHRRVDIIDLKVSEGYKYWTVRTQLHVYLQAVKAGEAPQPKKEAK